MDLTHDTVAQLLFPNAAVEEEPPSTSAGTSGKSDSGHESITWPTSSLNPKNRIDSLDEILHPRWRVDGCTGMGTHFYTIPTFLDPLIPMRIDTFIPRMDEIPTHLHEILDLSTALCMRDARVARLGISRYIVRVLEHWSRRTPDFKSLYNSLPFGSRIVLDRIDTNISSVQIQVLQTHFLERQLLSAEALQAMWNCPQADWPETLDISRVSLLQQLHDSVSLVRIHDQTFVLKSLTSSPKYLYHELKVLLSLPPHPNIISRPRYLITKRCKFGTKVAVVGLVLEYHPKGTLRDVIHFRRIHGGLEWKHQINWALQLTEALIHIRNEHIMYSDLRLDNIVLESQTDGIVMIDFESRGVATFMSAPEITYLEYFYSLSNDSSGKKELQKFKTLFGKISNEANIPNATEIYRNPQHGFCVSWLCLTEKEREAAQVYMLGRALWCIFEGVGSPENSIVVQHMREDSLEFPNWRLAPEKVRRLIRACCASAEEYHRFPLDRKGSSLYLRLGNGTEGPSEVRTAAVRWWQEELRRAENFLSLRMNDSSAGERIFDGRPTLEEVLLELKSLDIAA